MNELIKVTVGRNFEKWLVLDLSRMDTPGGTRDAAVSPRCDIRRKRGDGLSM